MSKTQITPQATCSANLGNTCMLQTWDLQTGGVGRSLLPLLMFIPNGSLGAGWGWWSPAFPARPWLCHLHPPKGRVCSLLCAHQPSPAQPALSTAWVSWATWSNPGSRTQGLGAAVQWLLSPEPSPRDAKFPPAMWKYEPGTVVRPHRVCFPQAALAEVTILPSESKKTSLHFIRNQQGAFLDLA